MGQGTSAEDCIQNSIDNIQEDVLRHTRAITEIAGLTYEEFVKHLGELNKLSRKYPDKQGRQLVFAVKKGTDSTILWKGTVRIGCVKVDPVTSSVENYRMINLAEFLRIFNGLRNHINCLEESEKNALLQSQAGFPGGSSFGSNDNRITMSMLFEQVSNENINNTFDRNAECCICLERSPEVILPCAHSYCLPCIEQWNVNNKTCPICREKLENTDDSWVISEAPDADEIAAEISATLDVLSKASPKHEKKT